MHLIRRIRLAMLAVAALAAVTAYAVDQSPKPSTKPADSPWSGRTVQLPKQLLKVGTGTIVLNIDLPRGYHIAAEVPTTVKWTVANDAILHLPKGINKTKNTLRFPVEAAVTAKAGTTELVIDAAVFFCENGSKLCQMDNVRIKTPIEISTTGAEKITLSVEAGEDFETED